MPHVSLKCQDCLLCIREGEPWRRLGSAVVTVWTKVGPMVLILCGRCAQRAGLHAGIENAIAEEEG